MFEGHQGPVTGISCHNAVGTVDFSHLFITCSFDWTVKLWSTKVSVLPRLSRRISGASPMCQIRLRHNLCEALATISILKRKFQLRLSMRWPVLPEKQDKMAAREMGEGLRFWEFPFLFEGHHRNAFFFFASYPFPYLYVGMRDINLSMCVCLCANRCFDIPQAGCRRLPKNPSGFTFRPPIIPFRKVEHDSHFTKSFSGCSRGLCKTFSVSNDDFNRLFEHKPIIKLALRYTAVHIHLRGLMRPKPNQELCWLYLFVLWL